MSADDWSAFAGNEHMFFGLADPYGLIREELERGLRQQVADTVVESIVTHGTPKYLTIGKRLTEGSSKVVVAHFAFCVAATVSLHYAGGQKRETLPVALTFAFGRVDEPGRQTSRSWFDLHDDAARAFDDEVLKERFLAFRAGLSPSPSE